MAAAAAAANDWSERASNRPSRGGTNTTPTSRRPSALTAGPLLRAHPLRSADPLTVPPPSVTFRRREKSAGRCAPPPPAEGARGAEAQLRHRRSGPRPGERGRRGRGVIPLRLPQDSGGEARPVRNEWGAGAAGARPRHGRAGDWGEAPHGGGRGRSLTGVSAVPHLRRQRPPHTPGSLPPSDRVPSPVPGAAQTQRSPPWQKPRGGTLFNHRVVTGLNGQIPPVAPAAAGVVWALRRRGHLPPAEAGQGTADEPARRGALESGDPPLGSPPPLKVIERRVGTAEEPSLRASQGASPKLPPRERSEEVPAAKRLWPNNEARNTFLHSLAIPVTLL